MSAYFLPRSFLMAILQRHSCNINVPLCNLKFSIDSGERDSKTGVLVYGLFLEGGSWNELSSCLEESEAGKLYLEMPKLNLVPVDASAVSKAKMFSCPMYNNTERRESSLYSTFSSNYIMSVDVKTVKTESHWIKRGTAILYQIDD
ncbi:hypothetical protein J437_LFUL003998 [Ladona fulva]|uniref:Dynein heavy chain C-terminal domain-containing protein n=1 Tax=Ladona fulva TaxID=123851 RepID=A0A8K0K4R0_LADFU|nr:hypothetical protein J437_LFUL003998 [Ladona fulva]